LSKQAGDFPNKKNNMLQLIDKVDADYVSNWESNLRPEDAADVRYNTLRVAYEWATSAGFGLELNTDEQTYCLTMPFGDRCVTMFEDLDVGAVVNHLQSHRYGFGRVAPRREGHQTSLKRH
jgi:hypothetical protein